MSMRWIRLAMLGAFTWTVSSDGSARAATAYDHFNDYGETRFDLLGNAGSESDGWAGPWENNGAPDYYPGVQLNYSALGYTNAPNQSDLNDGAAGISEGGGITASSVATRSFTAGLTGTVWVSALGTHTLSDQVPGETGNVLFWFDKAGVAANNDFMAIRGEVAHLRFLGVNQSTGSFPIDETHLLLAKIELDVSGANDAISFWVNPDLSGGEAGLPAPTLSASGADAYGAALDNIGVSFVYNGSFIDAIRVSNEADGFAKVVAPAATPPLAGDFDENGFVDGEDLADWKAGFGTLTDATHMQGDADSDEDVDGADFLIWQRQVGLGVPLAESAATATPEPASLALLGLGGLMGAMLVRRRCRRLGLYDRYAVELESFNSFARRSDGELVNLQEL